MQKGTVAFSTAQAVGERLTKCRPLAYESPAPCIESRSALQPRGEQGGRSGRIRLYSQKAAKLGQEEEREPFAEGILYVMDLLRNKITSPKHYTAETFKMWQIPS